ncbi:MAG: TonB-dependent receptor [Prevotellaceae bacterium]|jgi:TonB-linked SusC/RagA family outer membrane protein|nr:TonB-dependent receptor [Prevotellaceae bacterium]
MTSTFINGMKNAELKKLVSIMTLSAFLLLTVAWTASARGGDSSETLKSQQTKIRVTGTVVDPAGEPVVGATIVEKGVVTNGTTTDADGRFSLGVSQRATLVVSYIGYATQELAADSRTVLIVVLREDTQMLDEVTVVAFSQQKKESVIGAISTIRVTDLKIPSSNLTTAFAGRIAGMIAYQTSGEPGYDDASFFIRGITTFGAGKVDPLILIDNVEMSSSDLARLHPDDIASFSILKDATATALYGARGANGVVLVTTKEGKEGKVQVSFRFENSFSSPTSEMEMADPITYMRLANEAVLTRRPADPIPYSPRQIEMTADPNRNQFAYPAVDWMDMVTKNVTSNQRANLNISGGGTVARYYIAGSVMQDNGILKVDKRNNFNSNVNLKKYLIRSNININLTKSTEAIVRMHGSFDDYVGPRAGGSDMYKKTLQMSPTRFPAYFEPDKAYQGVGHILFGNDGTANYLNPYAELVRGYKQESKAVMMAQLELKQDFGKWMEGLTGRLLGNTTRNSSFDLARYYNPFYYKATYDRFADTYLLEELNTTGGSEYIRYYPGGKNISSQFYGEASLAYNRTFRETHAVSGMLVGIIHNGLTANAGSLPASLPQRNLGLSGRFTYNYDSRYFVEFNFGYNGSEKFDKGHRWGFFPSAGLGWLVSNESFWDGTLKDVISTLKFRITHGLVGNDEISSQRFFYISDVSIGGGGGYVTGLEFNGINRSGVKINNYANPLIGWETAKKTNLGIELNLFKEKVKIQADFYREHRTNILQSRADITSEMGLWATPQVNVGEAKGKGLDISVDYTHSVNRDVWLVGRANFTFARSTYAYYEEPDYEALGYYWRSRMSYPVSQQWGYVAERLFIDESDVLNSPRQDFSEYLPGDIKYKDINGDNVINEIDMVPIGYPTTPELNYGFGLSAGYKNLDASVFFQGSGRYSFWIDANAMSPFVQRTNSDGVSGTYDDNIIVETGLTKFIADNYWSETSQNPHASWPRLSNTIIGNNSQRSTWFMQDGSFLRLKSVELGYSLPKGWIDKFRLTSARFYVSGTNLLLFSKFKLWDVEMGGNGLNYPLQRVMNLGINLSF